MHYIIFVTVALLQLWAAIGTDVGTLGVGPARDVLWHANVRFGVASLPALNGAGTLMYTVSKIGILIALNVSTGSVVFQTRTHVVALTSRVSSPSVGPAAPGLAPGSCAEVVYVGGIFAVDACSGAQLWHAELHASNYSSPVPVPLPDGGVLLINGADRVYGVATATGRPLFNTSLRGVKLTKPVMVVVGLNTSSVAAVCLVCTSPDITRVGEKATPSKHDGSVYALDTASGAQLWAFRPEHGLAFLAAPAVFGGSHAAALSLAPRAYVASTSEHFYMHALVAETGAVLWAFQVPTRVPSTPVVASDGSLYFGSLGAVVFGLGVNSTQLWAAPVDAAVNTSPALGHSERVLFVSTTASTLYCIDRVLGTVLWAQRVAPSLVAPLLVPHTNDSVLVAAMGGLVMRLDGDRLGSVRHAKPATVEPDPRGAPPPLGQHLGGDVGDGEDGSEGAGDGEDNDGGENWLGGRDAEEEGQEYGIIIAASLTLLLCASALYWRWRFGRCHEACASLQRWKSHALDRGSGSWGGRWRGGAGTSRGLNLVPLLTPPRDTSTSGKRAGSAPQSINPFRSPLAPESDDDDDEGDGDAGARGGDDFIGYGI